MREREREEQERRGRDGREGASCLRRQHSSVFQVVIGYMMVEDYDITQAVYSFTPTLLHS